METIQVVLDKKLLQATDRAGSQTKRSRSALVRDALRGHIRRLEIRTREELDREGYSRHPRERDESLIWEAETVWPAVKPEATSVFASLLHLTRDGTRDDRLWHLPAYCLDRHSTSLYAVF